MNKPGWIEDLAANEEEKAFGNGPGQIGKTILRIRVPFNSTEFNRKLLLPRGSKRTEPPCMRYSSRKQWHTNRASEPAGSFQIMHYQQKKHIFIIKGGSNAPQQFFSTWPLFYYAVPVVRYAIRSG